MMKRRLRRAQSRWISRIRGCTTSMTCRWTSSLIVRRCLSEGIYRSMEVLHHNSIVATGKKMCWSGYWKNVDLMRIHWRNSKNSKLTSSILLTYLKMIWRTLGCQWDHPGNSMPWFKGLKETRRMVFSMSLHLQLPSNNQRHLGQLTLRPLQNHPPALTSQLRSPINPKCLPLLKSMLKRKMKFSQS